MTQRQNNEARAARGERMISHGYGITGEPDPGEMIRDAVVDIAHFIEAQVGERGSDDFAAIAAEAVAEVKQARQDAAAAEVFGS